MLRFGVFLHLGFGIFFAVSTALVLLLLWLLMMMRMMSTSGRKRLRSAAPGGAAGGGFRGRYVLPLAMVMMMMMLHLVTLLQLLELLLLLFGLFLNVSSHVSLKVGESEKSRVALIASQGRGISSAGSPGGCPCGNRDTRRSAG